MVREQAIAKSASIKYQNVSIEAIMNSKIYCCDVKRRRRKAVNEVEMIDAFG